MSWICLVIAGLLEVLGVVWLNEFARTKRKWLIIVMAITFIFSFSFLKMAMSTIPMGTSYAIWTGIGTAGGAIVGMIFYNESKHFMRLFFISLILISVIGLRLLQ
ncbi:multidrug efflux SMR transporter [Staphylococcus croceilyticus]|uniref:Multidrug efflux SMR transporter n=1 Tax=Staphylococcus croceilyticus TaxID=319942 RepID=A0ABY2KAD5_9STAP|nr:multidrug efflux SMR transporter [Staphylococcus croceilyticus]PNZ65995.1 QacE family quaternary ammonium compound efflux SMR transporter [Staphylococcus croceilyticus]TGA73111.1 multidrug efflux SMR transporter [Staphylococcus croceilyticus]